MDRAGEDNRRVNVALLVLIFVGMYLVCQELERACDDLAQRFAIPASIAGATLLAIASSAPEFFTGLLGAVVHGDASIGLSAILWSAIFNITVIPGVCALISKEPLQVSPEVLRRDCVAYAAITVLLLALIQDDVLTRLDACLLLGAYLIYLGVLAKMRSSGEALAEHAGQPAWRTLLGLVGGLALVGLLCHFMIAVGGELAAGLGISVIVVSALVFAPGTSLPDLLLSVFATRKGNASAAVSNAYGSNSFDLTVCLAAPVLVVGEIPVPLHGALGSSCWLLLALVVVTALIIRRGHRVERWEGGVLVGMFVGAAGMLVTGVLG